MSTTTSYEPHDYRRVCDECGVLRMRSDLHRKGRWILCWDCDAPGDRIREQEDAAIARQRPFRFLPVPNAKPQDYANPYNWQAEEAQVFNFIANTAPPSLSSSPTASAWPAIYLAQLIQQGTRPAIWLSVAARSLRAYVDNLLTGQYGSPTGISVAVTDPKYGGVSTGTSCSAASAAASGIAFLLAYATLGDGKYLTAADRCATFLRHAQCCDLLVSGWTVFPSGGAPYHLGGFSSVLAVSGNVYSTSYLLADVIALWFLQLLIGVRGLTAVYGDASSTSFFSAPTAAPLSQMLSELAVFASTGVFDSSAGGVAVTGLSTSKPQATYIAATNGGGGAGAWTSSATIAASAIALAVAGVFQAFGANAQVTAVLTWLASFGANAANATPATNSPQQTLDGITGVYSPATAPATSLTSSAPFTDAAGALYDLASLGVLAPVLNATNVAALKTSRSIVSPAVQYSANDLAERYLGPLGRAGLSLQPHSSAGAATPNVLFAAQFGAVYRYGIPAVYSIPGVSP